MVGVCIYIFFFPQKSGMNSINLHCGIVRKKLVKCYIWNIWSMALYGAETWTLRAADQEYLESFECGAGEGYHTEYVLQDTSKVRLSSTLLLPSVCN